MSSENNNNDDLKGLLSSAKQELIKAAEYLTALQKSNDLVIIQSGLTTIRKFVKNADDILNRLNEQS